MNRTITRSELYQRVWSEPMIHVAESFGISDVGLAKICRKHRIPRPPRGYWAKKQNGQDPIQMPLPRPTENEVIEMPVTVDQCQVSDGAVFSSKEKLAEILPEKPQIVLKNSLRGCHELITRFNQELPGIPLDSSGLLSAPEKCVLRIATSKSNVRRALLIFDALLTELEKQYPVTEGPVVTLLGIPIGISITEQLESKQSEKGADLDLDRPFSFSHNRFQVAKVPSGRLTLSIKAVDSLWSPGCRHTWKDSEKRRIDDQLSQVIPSMLETAILIKQHEEQIEKRRLIERENALRQQELENQRAERRKLQRAEQARVDELLEQVANWQKSQSLRNMIFAVQKLHSRGDVIDPENPILEWIDWATQQADRLDPLKECPASILDEDLGADEQSYRYGWRA